MLDDVFVKQLQAHSERLMPLRQRLNSFIDGQFIDFLFSLRLKCKLFLRDSQVVSA